MQWLLWAALAAAIVTILVILVLLVRDLRPRRRAPGGPPPARRGNRADDSWARNIMNTDDTRQTGDSGFTGGGSSGS
ncbi:hypothetical protein AB0F72_37785 [Actinoplanes sp. NPDC023936]|uniref:hypothetical protein n=1 Tax=Actinoplanes sp. NPDC023936 TaxID=3154910 RepID=UPI0033F04C8B